MVQESECNIRFGAGCIVHPYATIKALGGDIYFGDYNIIEEKVEIINQKRNDGKGQPIKKTMKIGNYNMFEVGASVDSTDIGD